MSNAVQNSAADYAIPEGPFCLLGPLAYPEPGQLPLRGDLAHIALAGTHLAAHYVIPIAGQIGAQDITLKHGPRDDADDHCTLAAGTAVEILDEAGAWVWLCTSKYGPAGYCLKSDLS